jgi:hypothetical protein
MAVASTPDNESTVGFWQIGTRLGGRLPSSENSRVQADQRDKPPPVWRPRQGFAAEASPVIHRRPRGANRPAPGRQHHRGVGQAGTYEWLIRDLTNPTTCRYREHTGRQIPKSSRRSSAPVKLPRRYQGGRLTDLLQPGSGVGFERSLNAGGTCASG